MSGSKKKAVRSEGPLSLPDLEARAQEAVDELEAVINRISQTPGLRDESRHAHLLSLYMSLLAERFGVLPPDSNPIDEKK